MIRKVLKLIFFSIFMLNAANAHALYYYGGDDDGYAVIEGISEMNYGFLGGNGEGNVSVLTSSWSLMAIESSAVQLFVLADASTAMNAVTLTQDMSFGNGVLAANDIRVKIPSAMDMAWDTTDTTAVLSGTASGKVSVAVSYEDSDKTLVLNVTSDFVDGEALVVSGLNFRNFNTVGMDNLELEIDNAGTTVATDLFLKVILYAERVFGSLGGNGEGNVSVLTSSWSLMAIESSAGM